MVDVKLVILTRMHSDMQVPYPNPWAAVRACIASRLITTSWRVSTHSRDELLHVMCECAEI